MRMSRGCRNGNRRSAVHRVMDPRNVGDLSINLGRNRVLPAKTGEAAEVTVRRCQRAPMVERQCGQVGIGNEIRSRGDLRDQLAEDLAVALRRLGNPDRLAVEPLLDLLPCRAHRLGPREDAGVGDQPQECEQARPRQPNTCATIHPLV